MLGVLYGDAHLLEGQDRPLADVAGPVGHGELKVGAGVEGGRRVARVTVGKVEELDLGGGVKGESLAAGALQGALEDVARVSLEG